MYTVSLEIIAKIRTYIVTLSSFHNELFLIPFKHIKQIKGVKKRKKEKFSFFSYFCRSKASDSEYMFKKSYIYLSSYCLNTTLIDWALFFSNHIWYLQRKNEEYNSAAGKHVFHPSKTWICCDIMRRNFSVIYFSLWNYKRLI